MGVFNNFFNFYHHRFFKSSPLPSVLFAKVISPGQFGLWSVNGVYR